MSMGTKWEPGQPTCYTAETSAGYSLWIEQTFDPEGDGHRWFWVVNEPYKSWPPLASGIELSHVAAREAAERAAHLREYGVTSDITDPPSSEPFSAE